MANSLNTLKFLDQISLKKAVLGFFLMFVLVGFFNRGFMAVDEYWTAIVQYIPAQNSSLKTLTLPDEVKSPLQILPMHLAAQVSYKLGVTSPYTQYSFVVFALSVINGLMLLWGFFVVFPKTLENSRPLKMALLFSLIYLGFVFVMTRPMYESLAAPSLLLAAGFGLRYDHTKNFKHLALAITFSSLAFVLRQQLGFCALACVALPVLHKNWRHLVYAGALGLFFLIITGIPDYFLRGQFHHSLISLTTYNIKYGHEYANRPWYYFFPLFFVLSMAPFLIARYSREFVLAHLKNYRMIYMQLILFLALHSFFPNKYERFTISLLPLFIVLFTVFALELDRLGRFKTRLVLLLAFNLPLTISANVFPPQQNLTGLSRWIDEQKDVRSIVFIDDSLEYIFDAFIERRDYGLFSSQQTPDWQTQADRKSVV